MTGTDNSTPLLCAPGEAPHTFMDFPLAIDPDQLAADIAILGVPFGMPYQTESMANDQSRAPDVIRQFTNKTVSHTIFCKSS